jgi:hypothetical protein
MTTARPLLKVTGGTYGNNYHQFGFNIASTNATVVVEACTNMGSGVWLPIRTLTPTNGSAYFSEPLPPNSPGRFYRVRSP